MRFARTILVMASMVALSANAQPSPPRARIVKSLRLDATAEEFTYIGRMAVGPRGEMAIPQVMDAVLRIYDSTGKRIATVGRRGSGPGEFRFLSGIGWFADTIWAHDDELHRSTYIRANGAIVRTATITGEPPQNAPRGAGPQLMYFSPAAAVSDGSAIGTAHLGVAPRSGEGIPEEIRVVRRFSNGSMRVLATIDPMPADRYMAVSSWRKAVPFAALPRLTFASDGSRFSYVTTDITSRDGGTFTVTLSGANGDTIFSRTFPFRGVPIPRRSLDSAIAELNPGVRRNSESSPEIDKQFQEQARKKLPSFYAPVDRVIIGLDKTIWLVLHGTSEGQIALVLNGRGDPINTVLMPRQSNLMQADASHLWMMEESETDLTSIVRYSVHGIACGAACR